MKKKNWITLFLTLVLIMGVFPVNADAAKATVGTAGVYKWKQTDSRWNDIYKGGWSSGCATTAVAIQIARTDLVWVDESAKSFDPKTGTGFNPGTLAKALKLNTSTISIGNWSVTKAIPGFKFADDDHFGKEPSGRHFCYYPAGSKKDIIDSMRYYLENNLYPVIEGPGSKWNTNKNKKHYVAVVKVTKDDVRVIDPADGKEKSLFDVSLNGNKWTPANIEACGDPPGYGCCMLYKVDSSKKPSVDFKNMAADQYMKFCKQYPSYCEIKVNISKKEYICTMPCSSETNVNSTAVRELKNGETLTAVRLYVNTAGRCWYKVDLGGGKTGYVYGGCAKFVKALEEQPTFSDEALFKKITYKKSYGMKGKITTKYTDMLQIQVTIVDAAGKKYTQSQKPSGYCYSFKLNGSNINKNLKFAKLAKGTAKITYTITLSTYYCTDGQNFERTEVTFTRSWDFTVV